MTILFRRLFLNSNLVLNILKMNLTTKTEVKGMKVLDRTVFSNSMTVSSLNIKTENLNKIRKCIKKYLLKLDNYRPVQEGLTNTERIIYFDPKIKNFEDLSVDDQETLKSFGFTHLDQTEINYDYNNWRLDEILRLILPGDGLTSYSRIGHIIHVNLHEHLLEYKHIIGELLFDKIKGIKTVVNKAENIDNTYRNFHLEVLKGESNFITTAQENHCKFELDFSKVYWNPRLSTEHERIVNILQKDDILFDLFAGVGPFSIPAAKKGVKVFANDLNPNSYHWLEHNSKLNKVKCECFNIDAKDLIRNQFKQYLINHWNEKLKNKIHIVMNLPAIAVDFLQYFKNLIPNEVNEGILPQVHVYCFVFDHEPENSSLSLVQEKLNHKIEAKEIKFVRKVSPSKDMMRVSFDLPYEILIESNEPLEKRLKSS